MPCYFVSSLADLLVFIFSVGNFVPEDVCDVKREENSSAQHEGYED